ncbi:MAG: ABC transporter substrate-binding protein [Melioribacteraceae bacterium]
MKKFLIVILMIVLVSCSGRNRNDHEIVFWHSFVPATQPALNKMIEKFEKENPDIHIKAQYVPTGDALVQKLITSLQSGTQPDIAWIHSDFIDKLIEGDAIYDLEHFIKSSDGLTQEEINDFFPELLKSAMWDGKLYALPMEATVLALHYNKDAFKAAGLNPNEPPKTWDELYEAAKKLTVDKDNDGKIDQYGFYIPVFPASGQLSIWMVLQWEPFVWQAGGKIINDEQTKLLIDQAPAIEALSFWKKMYDMMHFSNFTLSHDLGFSSGTLAMVMDGPWNLPMYKKLNKFKWGIASLPAGPKEKATFIAGEHLAIFKKTKEPEKAWKFVKWFTQPQNQALFSELSGYLPVRKSTLELESYKKFLSEDEYMNAYIDQIKIAKAQSSIDHYKIEINQIIAEAVEQTILGNKDPADVLKEQVEKGNKLLESIKQ